MVLVLLIPAMLNSMKAATQVIFKEKTDTSDKKITLVVLPQNFYIKRLGFFCKRELEVQKGLSLPIYFRLGNKDYVDRLEGKHPTPEGIY